MKKSSRILIVRSEYNDTKDMETITNKVIDANKELVQFLRICLVQSEEIHSPLLRVKLDLLYLRHQENLVLN